MSTTIEDRLIFILQEDAQPRGYWQQLEERTQISAQRWRKALSRRQRPTPDMIEVMAKLKPEYAFWLATGITDAAHGHLAPVTALTFPERGHMTRDIHAHSYFCQSLDLAEQLFRDGKIDCTSEEQRMAAAERVLVGAQRHGSRLVDVGYRIAKTEAYQHLQELAAERRDNAKKDKRIARATGNAEQEDPIHVVDKRTSHQHPLDLFWEPQVK